MSYITILKYYIRQIKGDGPMLVAGLFSYAVAAVAGSGVLMPVIYGKIIDTVNSGEADSYEKLINLTIVLGVALLAVNIYYRIGDFLTIKFDARMEKKLNDYAFDRLKDHSYNFFSNTFSGSLIAQVKRFVAAYSKIINVFIWSFWTDGIKLIFTFIVLSYYSYTLSLIFLVWLVFFMMLTAILVKFQVKKSEAMAVADSNTTSRLSDFISNIITVKIFAKEDSEKNSYEEVTKEQSNYQRIAWMQEGFWGNGFQGFFTTTLQIIMIYTAVVLWHKGLITAGTIVVVQVYLLSIFDIVWGLSRQIIKISTAMSEASEIIVTFEKGYEIFDPSNPEESRISSGKVEFDNVSFKYKKGVSLFENLNLIIEPGEKVALVGHSGAGKTTIAKLLLRFIDIDSGSIKIDGQDISKIRQKDLREAIGYVPQDTALFHRTIRENIAYARPDSSEKEIKDVSIKAHVDDFVVRLPEKYESLVGERGVKLSGGERQRIAIARAMLKNAPIIILDEATSSLDSVSEEKIQSAFIELMKGKTTIVIAHRLSTIKNMDRIIVFEEGRIVEDGTHKDLISKKGHYAELWNSQVGGFI